ncbi:hypothetical protein BKA70DRAFT_1280034, partial [Coprinopsis sp. MPI-PUGE-AT-0042]
QADTKWIRNPNFYFQNVVIGVEDRLYSIPKQVLVCQSPGFKGMFDVPTDGTGEGENDEKPIVLEGYKSNDFEYLLKVLYPCYACGSLSSRTTTNEWVSVLKLSTIWQMDKIRDMAIVQLSACEMLPIEKLQYAREYRVPKWLTEGVIALANELSNYEGRDLGKALGWETTALILDIRDKARPKVDEALGRVDQWTCVHCGSRLAASTNQRTVCCTGPKCTWVINQIGGVTSKLGEVKEELSISQDAVAAAFEDEIKSLQA